MAALIITDRVVVATFLDAALSALSLTQRRECGGGGKKKEVK